MVANLGLGDAPLRGAVFDCSLEAPTPDLTKASLDPDSDPKEGPCFIQVGKRDLLPQIHGCPVVTASSSRCQSHFTTMPYKVSGTANAALRKRDLLPLRTADNLERSRKPAYSNAMPSTNAPCFSNPSSSIKHLQPRPPVGYWCFT